MKSKSRKVAVTRRSLQKGVASVVKLTSSGSDLPARLRRIKLFLCDVDGILTDGGVYMGGETEFKRFNILDGLGLRFLQSQNIRVGWISNRPSYATAQRAADLKVDFIHQGDGSKVEAAERFMQECRCDWPEIVYMGDDVVDLGLLRRAGVAVTVPHACREVQMMAHYVTKSAPGHGAVREVVEIILKAQNKWENLVESFLK